MKASEKMRQTADLLLEWGISSDMEDAMLEAGAIFRDALGMDRLVLMRDDPELNNDELARLARVMAERKGRKPLQYITGHCGFYGLDIIVGPGVLVPRPETEFLAEEAIARIKARPEGSPPPRVLDLCTGSGCLALAIASYLPGSEVTGTDISPKALEFARKNAETNRLRAVKFHEGHLYEPVRGWRFDLIVSNPPYIKSWEIPALQPEVRDWEPREALDGGTDGMDVIREILAKAPDFLEKGGLIMLELGVGQAAEVEKSAVAAGLTPEGVIADPAGCDRIFLASY